mgnify:CR=1 FL=1
MFGNKKKKRKVLRLLDDAADNFQFPMETYIWPHRAYRFFATIETGHSFSRSLGFHPELVNLT